MSTLVKEMKMTHAIAEASDAEIAQFSHELGLDHDRCHMIRALCRAVIEDPISVKSGSLKSALGSVKALPVIRALANMTDSEMIRAADFIGGSIDRAYLVRDLCRTVYGIPPQSNVMDLLGITSPASRGSDA